MVTIDKERDTVLLEDVSWNYYTQTLHEIGHGATRVVYDEGRMEIMTVSNEHERAKKAAARLLEAYADQMGFTMEGIGNVTLRRQDLGKGLEPDECYYVTSEQPPSSSEGMDILNFPPPDLAIEVEITRGTLSKRSIYAQLGVNELWRWDGSRMRVLQLRQNKTYEEIEVSGCFPDLSLEAFSHFLLLAIRTTQSAAVKAWREHLRM